MPVTPPFFFLGAIAGPSLLGAVRGGRSFFSFFFLSPPPFFFFFFFFFPRAGQVALLDRLHSPLHYPWTPLAFTRPPRRMPFWSGRGLFIFFGVVLGFFLFFSRVTLGEMPCAWFVFRGMVLVVPLVPGGLWRLLWFLTGRGRCPPPAPSPTAAGRSAASRSRTGLGGCPPRLVPWATLGGPL